MWSSTPCDRAKRVARNLLLLLSCVPPLLCGPEAGATSLLADGFATLDPIMWSVGSNGGGDAWASGDSLTIRSGATSGGGTWVESLAEFRPEDHAGLTLEGRCRAATPWTGYPDYWSCGLAKVVGSSDPLVYAVFIGAGGPEGRLTGTAQNGSSAVRQEVEIPGNPDYTQWHDYRIVVTAGRVDFQVDGEYKASIVDPSVVPSDVAMSVRLDRGSPGFDDYLHVDSVALDAVPPAGCADAFRDDSWCAETASAAFNNINISPIRIGQIIDTAGRSPFLLCGFEFMIGSGSGATGSLSCSAGCRAVLYGVEPDDRVVELADTYVVGEVSGRSTFFLDTPVVMAADSRYAVVLETADPDWGLWQSCNASENCCPSSYPVTIQGDSAVYGPSEDDYYFALWKSTLNNPPDCSAAAASVQELWPPNHRLVPVSVVGVTDPDGDPVTVTVTGVTQDEPLEVRADGSSCPDAEIDGAIVYLRSERTALGNGRVYEVAFTADDGQDTCRSTVKVCVPHDRGGGDACTDDGQIVDSMGPCGPDRRPVSRVVGPGMSVRQGEGAVTIAYSLDRSVVAQLQIYDVAGRHVATLVDRPLVSGAHEATWSLAGQSSGVYFARLRIPGHVETERIVVVK